MVYVVQEVYGRNILPAQKFGELTYILDPNVQISSGSSAGIIVKMKEKLKDFCDDDCLLLMGDPTAMGIATAVACMFNDGNCNLLKWDRQESMYYPVKINL